jgi:hypothetical protein
MIKLNRALGRCLAGSVLGALMAVAFIPPATAQWAPPWGALFPGDIERSLEAQGYVLTAPLMRRPGVYLADVSAGRAGHQRLITDARSGQILEHFITAARNCGPALAARDEEFGDTQFGGVGSPLNRSFSGPAARVAPLANAGPANVHILAAVSPYGVGGQAEVRPDGTQDNHQPASAASRSTRNGKSERIRLGGAPTD